jgi:AcrR family transcriptional regulator
VRIGSSSRQLDSAQWTHHHYVGSRFPQRALLIRLTGAAPMSTLKKAIITTYTSMNDKIEDLMSSRDITQKGAERIVEIARVGAEILLEEGFTSVTKRRVANRLGISHGHVGYYFPTRESLWQAVVDYEFRGFYKKYQSDLKTNPDDPQSCFDEYLVRWMDEYQDRKVRTFFAHVDAYAEINSAVAKLRDEIYEGILMRILKRVRPLCIGVNDEQLKRRAMTVMLLFEGLGPVSAFRPELVEQNSTFRQHMIDQANAIIRGK